MKKISLKHLLKIKNGRDHKNLNAGKIPVYGSASNILYNKILL